MSTKSIPLSSARHKLLHAAAELFYNDGLGASGIDAIVKKAGVAKKSLYNNFDSKNALILAYLEQRHTEWLALYEQRLITATTPSERVLAIFDAYIDHAEWGYEKGFRGCGALNAAAELSTQHVGRDTVRSQKETIQNLLHEHLTACFPAKTEQVTRLAQHLSFVLEGAVVRAGLEGQSRCLHEAKHIAAELIR
ncbi:TetR/AcrR family transcriptional regulator [Paenalcaligenes hominis]|uniref:TetR/AcrR family transcriptional regulator n=1 Tax=Paenalcaligenes hominis TaxID=643674 RepID=UPI0035266B2D